MFFCRSIYTSLFLQSNYLYDCLNVYLSENLRFCRSVIMYVLLFICLPVCLKVICIFDVNLYIFFFMSFFLSSNRSVFPISVYLSVLLYVMRPVQSITVCLCINSHVSLYHFMSYSMRILCNF